MLFTMQIAKRTSDFSMPLTCILDEQFSGRVGSGGNVSSAFGVYMGYLD